MRNFDYLEPKSVAEACALLKQHGGEAKIFAGGAHLTILMKQGLYQPKALVNIKKIPELRGIKYDDAEGLTIGTVGGNLASGEPLTDLSQIFIALDARAEITGPGGQRTILLEELFVDFYQT